MSAVNITPEKTALVVIDLQNGVAALPTSPHSSGDVIDRTSQIAEALRARGGAIVWVTVDAPVGPAALHPSLDNPPQYPAEFPAGWSELRSEIDVRSEDIRVSKRNWGAFYGTDLDLQLRRRGIDTIILAGIATNLGVESTARDAFERGFNQIFVEDAMSGLGEGTHAMAVGTTFPRMGIVRRTKDLLEALRSE